jgi:5-methyltetrahydrofolate--homocysteine methyltransferase
MIGGATTSRAHTAVKIAPAYDGLTVHVARRVARRRGGGAGGVDRAAPRARRRESPSSSTHPACSTPRATPAAAAAARGGACPRPRWRTGATSSRRSNRACRCCAPYPLDELVDRIDWGPFFQPGSSPAASPRPGRPRGGRRTPASCTRTRWRCWRRIVDRGLARGPGGLRPLPRGRPRRRRAGVRGRGARDASARSSRRSGSRPPSDPDNRNLALADYVAPEGGPPRLGRRLRRRRSTAPRRARQAFEAEHDDYQAIMVKALADRLAEAAAERLHELVRTRHWGYAPDERLSTT